MFSGLYLLKYFGDFVWGSSKYHLSFHNYKSILHYLGSISEHIKQYLCIEHSLVIGVVIHGLHSKHVEMKILEITTGLHELY